MLPFRKTLTGGEMSLQEHPAAQQKEMPNPDPGEKQTQALLQDGEPPTGRQLEEERPWDFGGHLVEQEPAVCLCGTSSALEELLPAGGRR